MPPARPGDPRHYDLYVSVGARFYFHNPNHGVTLSDEGLAWRADGRDDHAAFANIGAVHLQSGGDWRNAIDQCRLELADGSAVIVTNADALGLPNEQQTALYRAFVRDLHRRIVVAGAPIHFSAGYSPGRYRVILICVVLVGLMFIGIPLVMLMATWDTAFAGLLLAGFFFCWPLVLMLRNNAPRDDRPDIPPDKLLR